VVRFFFFFFFAGVLVELGAAHPPPVLHLPPALAPRPAALRGLRRLEPQQHLALLRHQRLRIQLAHGRLAQAGAQRRHRHPRRL